jgi:hypothetical protein
MVEYGGEGAWIASIWLRIGQVAGSGDTVKNLKFP